MTRNDGARARADVLAFPASGGGGPEGGPTAFNRAELAEILKVYGRMVALGEWRDYAIDLGKDDAVFSIYRRTSEVPLYRVVKTPRNARRQGAYAVISAGGVVLKRGHDLQKVLRVLEKKRHLAVVE